MDLLRYLLIFRARYKAALAVLLLTIATVMIASEQLPRRYIAETALIVDIRSPDPIAAAILPAMMIPGNLGTQVDIIKSDRVAGKVVRMLRLDDSPAAKQSWQIATEGRGKFEDWMAGLLQRGLKVTPSRDSNVLSISYQGADPGFVAAVANAYAQAYIEASVELRVEPARQYALWFGEQAKLLRENVEKAQARLSEFQMQKGVVASDESTDSEYAILRELTTRLTAAQAETRDAQTKQRSAASTSDTLPEVMQNTVVMGLRSSIAQLEVKLKEAAVNLGVKHPQYQRMESELAELKHRLAVESKHVAGGYSSTTIVGKAREAELKAAIAAQTKKVLDVKKERDEIAVLVRDIETAKRGYEAVTSRLTQTSLESQATRTNISVLTPAVEPIEPSFPKPRNMTFLIALALGIFLAVAAMAGLEFIDRRIRTADDLAEMLQLPVLAVIEPSRRPRALAFRARAVALLGQ